MQKTCDDYSTNDNLRQAQNLRLTQTARADTLHSMKSIRERRQEKGLTLAELGRMIGLHPSNISRIETGLQLPSVSAAINLAEVLNITMDEIYMADHDEE